MTQIHYTPTLMEKLLGRWYKWWYLTVYSFKQTNLKLTGFFILNLASVLDFLITLYLWKLIEPTPDRISYLFFGFIFQRLIWSQYMMTFGTEIFSGKMNNKLILPISNFGLWLFREIGSSSIRNLISALLIMLFLPFYSSLLLFPSFTFIIALPILLACAFMVDYCASYIFGSLAFWTEDYRPIGFLFSVSVKVLSGLIIPFHLLNNNLNIFLQLNPYSLVAYHPMQIYLGNYNTNQTILVFLGGIIWCLVLYFLAKFVFRLGLKRNESVGL